MATLPKKVLGVADVWNKYHYKLFVYLIEAKGLKGVDKDGTCDPLCKITLGKVTHKSKVLKKTTDPQFSELFFFVDPEDPICRVEVWDNKKGKFLGQCDIVHLETVLSEKVHDLWFDLQSRPNKKKKDDVSGRVHCRILVSKVFETRNGEEITYKAFFQHHLGQYKTGDLIVYSGIGLLPATTKVLTGCPYSHVGLVVELPNRWTKIPELYVVEIFRNPENFLSVHNDQASNEISMFRLIERFYQFYGTQIWYVPLKQAMDATGVARILDFVQTCLTNPSEVRLSTEHFDRKIQSWIQTSFGAKHFQDPKDFVDLTSGSFITECLRIAELVPNGTPKAASPLATVSYPCYSEPVLIRPFDQSELEKLQRGLSSGQLFSGSDSQSSLNSLDRRSSDSVLKLEKRASLVVGVGEVNEQHVMRIYFEGFKDLTMLTMPMREGETCGDFRQSIAQKKQLDPKSMTIFECFNEAEIMVKDSDMLKLHSLKDPSLNYQIKVRQDYVPETVSDDAFGGAKFGSASTLSSQGSLDISFAALGQSTQEVGAAVPGRSMIVEQFNSSKVVKYEKLGGGAFGSVWRVGFEGFTCAMKVLSISSKTDAYDVEAMKMETEILQRANHKNIVRFLGYEFNESEMMLYLEYMPFSLRGALNSMKPTDVTVKNCKNIILGVARGINYMHNLTPPIIHRDIKSANILVTRDSTGVIEMAKLCDFGVSKLVDRDTQAQTYVGTLAFMAPEIRQGRGKKIYTPAIDIYSFGIVIWEILTLQQPHKITRRPEWSGLEYNPLYDLQAQCCKANPAQRPTAKQIADALALMDHD